MLTSYHTSHSPLFTQKRLDAYLIDFAKSLFKGFTFVITKKEKRQNKKW